jgi:FkbM family methyltransferase
MSKLFNIVRYILSHPLGKRHKLKSFFNFLFWQITQTVFPNERIVKFVGGAKMLVKKNDTGVTGNIYVGIQDFEEISFALHALREGDIFVDIGANIGFYSVIISKVKKARVFAFEPIPSTFQKLKKNIELNSLQNLISPFNIAIGATIGSLNMTSNLDTVNHVQLNSSDMIGNISVDVAPLDSILSVVSSKTSIVKIDVEGFETEVIKGMPKILASPHLKAIIIELNGSGGRYGFDELLIHQNLIENSFVPYKYDPFTRQLGQLCSYGENNTIYVRDLAFVYDRINSSQPFQIFDEII